MFKNLAEPIKYMYCGCSDGAAGGDAAGGPGDGDHGVGGQVAEDGGGGQDQGLDPRHMEDGSVS